MDSLNDNEELTIEDEQYDSLEAVIEEEVTKFINTFFAKELKDTEEKLNFIEEYSLFVPLKNYFLGINIFQKIYRQLKLIDGSFASSTLVKLEREISFLYSEYNYFLKKTTDSEVIFKKDILNSSIILKKLKIYINKQRVIKVTNSQMAQEVFELENTYDKLKNIYFEIYEDMLNDAVIQIKRDYLDILNTFLVYFEACMWNDAKLSLKIKKHYQNFNMESLDTKTYINYILKIATPYTKEYETLKQFSRNYK